MPTWLRVRDRDTGHEYDLRHDDRRIRLGLVDVLTGYPPNTGASARPRRAKHRVTKSGRPARPKKPAEDNKEVRPHGTA